MSHFTVMVVGDDIEEQLAPFQENNNGDCPKEYLEFNDTEDESLHDYHTKTCTRVRLADGVMAGAYDEQFNNPNWQPGESQRIYPEGSVQVEVPLREFYATFEEYMTEYCGSRARDEEMGRYGYWENPKAKWDWFQIGGRWAGNFIIKPEFLSEYADKVPEFSWGWSAEEINRVTGENRVDSALKKHIDWIRMRAIAETEAAELWDKVYAIRYPHPAIETWVTVRETLFPGDIEAARNFYNEQPAIVALRKWDRENQYPLGPLMDPDQFLVPKDAYVKSAGDKELSCFAFLKDKEWRQTGQMGWFGCVHGEKDPETWASQFAALLASVGDDERLTCVDCHI